MNSEQKIGVIRELENLPSMSKADGVFNVEEFRKSIAPTPQRGKLLEFPKTMDESPLRSAFDGMFAPIPKFVRASDAAIYKSFPSLSAMQCECEDCECKEHPTNFVETRYASFKLCETCTDDCATNVDKVVDLEALTDEQLCNDWELRR